MTVSCVFVVGTTGVGKSQLAIDLARELNGVVINADSMQVYDGLNVLTNKVTRAEMQGVEHALLGTLQPGDEYFVGDFVRDAQRELSRCSESGKTPIVAGGTAYYAQNLLFDGGLSPSHARDEILVNPFRRAQQDASLSSRIDSLPSDLLELLRVVLTLPNTPSPSQLPPDFPYDLLPPSLRSPVALADGFYRLLGVLDPPMASRWHPRDIRKVRRNIEICLEQGKPATESVAEQERPQARYHALVFWLRCDSDMLDTRLDKRVDKMVKNGLVEEVRQLHSLQKARGLAEDTTSGIFQAIGFREFLGYLQPPCSCSPAANHPRLDTEQEKLAHAIERTKLSTRQYAKKQLQWLHRRFLPACLASKDVEVVALDASDANRWNMRVRLPALEAHKTWLAGDSLPALSPELKHLLSADDEPASKAFETCESCSQALGQPFSYPPQQRTDHLASKAHRYRAKAQR